MVTSSTEAVPTAEKPPWISIPLSPPVMLETTLMASQVRGVPPTLEPTEQVKLLNTLSPVVIVRPGVRIGSGSATAWALTRSIPAAAAATVKPESVRISFLLLSCRRRNRVVAARNARAVPRDFEDISHWFRLLEPGSPGDSCKVLRQFARRRIIESELPFRTERATPAAAYAQSDLSLIGILRPFPFRSSISAASNAP